MIGSEVSRVMLGYISTRDHNLMRRLNGWRPPRWVRIWMTLASRLGDGWLWYAIGLILLLFGGSGRYVAVGSAAVSASISILLFLQLKKLARRKRPCAIERCSWSTLLPPDQFSFPSAFHRHVGDGVALPEARRTAERRHAALRRDPAPLSTATRVAPRPPTSAARSRRPR